MEAETARYLLSALVQATAVAWALVMTVLIYLLSHFLKSYDQGIVIHENLTPDEQIQSLEQQRKSTITYSFGMALNFWALIFLSVFALSTIIVGTYGLYSIDGYTFLQWTIDATIWLSIITFIFMFLAVFNFAIGGYSAARGWGKQRVRSIDAVIEKELHPNLEDEE